MAARIVYFEPGGVAPFVARCLAKATPEVPATCIRDVNIGRGLSMLYRFDRVYLGDWQDLDAGCSELGSRFFRRAVTGLYSRSMSRIAIVKL